MPYAAAPASSRKRDKGAGFTLAMIPVKVKVVLLVVILILCACLVDNIGNANRIYAGVKVGTVDVGGMTREEAQEAITAAYAQQVANAQMHIYAKEGIETSEEAQELSKEITLRDLAGEGIDEETYYWKATATELDATIADKELAESAYETGRGIGKVFERLALTFGGTTLEPYAKFNDSALESFALVIDEQIGLVRQDYDVDISHGIATVTAGYDGNMVDEGKLCDALNAEIFTPEESWQAAVVYTEYTPVRISYEAASQTADKINYALSDGVVFYYEGSGWQVTPTMVGDWLYTEVRESGDGYELKALISEASARASMLDYINANLNLNPVMVSFKVDGDSVTVIPGSSGKMPCITEAVAALQEAMFGEEPQEGALAADGVPVSIEVGSTSIPDSMDLQSAIDNGIISLFSEYTTSYSTGSTKEARNYNIHRMADLLNYSVASANGGVWSMNTISGPSDEAHGFKAATIILDNEHVDAIGGGICQVATTVFNAVYEAGFPIVERANHSLYVATYPAGRDAAVSYDDLDFKWQNDSNSDVLVVTEYTDTTLTAKLYGVSPRYEVVTETGEWQAGDAYETKYIIDENQDEDYSKVTEEGEDAKSIVINRKVYNRDGELLRSTDFVSKYDATTEIITIGPGEFADEVTEKKLVLKVIEKA